MNRKTCLKFNFICSWFISMLLVVSASAIEKKDTVSFIHITDTHLIFNSSDFEPGFIQSRINYFGDDVNPFVEFFQSIQSKNKNDFVALTGDFIDFYEAESVDGKLLGMQIEQSLELLNRITNVPVYLTLGNHDVTSYPKGSYHQYNSEKARSTWIKSAPCFSPGTYYSRIFAVDTTVYRLIFLNNSYFSENKGSNKARFIIDKPQLNWLEDQLNKSDKDVEILFMHMPLPFTNGVNVANSAETFQEYTERTRTHDLLDVINNAENAWVKLIVAGHWHQNNLHQFKFSEDLNFTQVLTGAFGNDVGNWRKIQLTDSEIIICEPGNSNILRTISLK